MQVVERHYIPGKRLADLVDDSSDLVEIVFRDVGSSHEEFNWVPVEADKHSISNNLARHVQSSWRNCFRFAFVSLSQDQTAEASGVVVREQIVWDRDVILTTPLPALTTLATDLDDRDLSLQRRANDLPHSA